MREFINPKSEIARGKGEKNNGTRITGNETRCKRLQVILT